jgi:hypothetical protein
MAPGKARQKPMLLNGFSLASVAAGGGKLFETAVASGSG